MRGCITASSLTGLPLNKLRALAMSTVNFNVREECIPMDAASSASRVRSSSGTVV